MDIGYFHPLVWRRKPPWTILPKIGPTGCLREPLAQASRLWRQDRLSAGEKELRVGTQDLVRVYDQTHDGARVYNKSRAASFLSALIVILTTARRRSHHSVLEASDVSSLSQLTNLQVECTIPENPPVVP